LRSRRHPRRAAFVATAIALVYLLPLLYVLSSSFKPASDILALPPKLLFHPTLDHYREALRQPAFARGLGNSLVITLASTALAVLLGSAAAYAVSRFRVGSRLSAWILMTRMIPPITIVVPFFLVYRSAGLIDTQIGLIAAYTAFNLPLVIWLLIGFFDSIPRDYDEAATLDGARVHEVIRYVVWPLARSGLAGTCIITAIYSWNEFLFALILTSDNARTAPVGMTQFISERGINFGALAAAGMIISLPILALALIARRQLVQGLSGQLK
jgi:multiple sugar transport system permease protein